MNIESQIAKELGHYEFTNVKVSKGDADFQVNGVWYYVKLTKTGKVKKNSLRRS